MNKYIDSIDEIHKNTRGEVYRSEIVEILQYLDDHPELTGKAITESEHVAFKRDVFSGKIPADKIAAHLDITIVPDPEPTNAERLADVYRSWYGGDEVPNSLIQFMDQAGVTAPEET